MAGPSPISARRPHAGRLARPALALAVAALTALVLWPQAASAGQASSGELLFYPCSSCHPVTKAPGAERPSKKMPGDFPGHEIVLEGHDALGKGDAACLACHEEPGGDPGKLKLADGTTIDITDDTAKVCYRCHSDKYAEWEAGEHGPDRDTCTAAGCHDPHTPRYIFASALFPFVGSGFQFEAVAERAPFMPLMPPPPPAPVRTPAWFVALTLLGVAAAGGLITRLIQGRRRS